MDSSDVENDDDDFADDEDEYVIHGTFCINSDRDLFHSEYSDDEDISWRVRKACAKVLATIIASLGWDLLSTSFEVFIHAISKRLKDRNEIVKLEVYDTFDVLIERIGADEKSASSSSAWSPVIASSIIGVMKSNLSDKSIRVKCSTFSSLTHLINTFPNSTFSDQTISSIMEASLSILSGPLSSDLPMKVLQLYNAFLSRFQWSVVKGHSTIWKVLADLISKKIYHTSAAALGSFSLIIKCSSKSDTADPNLMPLLFNLLKHSMVAIDSNEIDFEAKEKYIEFLVIAFTTIDHPDMDIIWRNDIAPKALSIMKSNEVLRVKVIGLFMEALRPKEHNGKFWTLDQALFSSLIEDAVSYLKKLDRSLKITSIKLLSVLIKRQKLEPFMEYETVVKACIVPGIIQSLTIDIGNVDSQYMNLSLCLLLEVFQMNSASLKVDFGRNVIPALVASYSKDGLIQGEALESFLILTKEFGRVVGLEAKDIVESLIQSIEGNFSLSNKQASSPAFYTII